jgi:hypothetical protein
MKPFIKKIMFFSLVSILVVEFISRLMIDPVYYATIDTYNLPYKGLAKVFGVKKTPRVDFLFIGSSRVPAAINADIFVKKDTNSIAIVAGRGYMTAGVHYQAISNRLRVFPDYLKNAVVFLEYPSYPIYTNHFEIDRYRVYESEHTNRESMAHLILPHLDFASFIIFLRDSKNSSKVKMRMISLYFLSSYRTMFFINEQWEKLDKPIFLHSSSNLAEEGGIREDRIERANQLAVEMAEVTRISISKAPPLTEEMLNKSSLAHLAKLISRNGGTLVLFQMPLHSLQNIVYENPKSQQDIMVFEDWLEQKDIILLKTGKFH